MRTRMNLKNMRTEISLACCFASWLPSQTLFNVWLAALQADKQAHGRDYVRRVLGVAASYLLNNLPAALEAALSRDATFPGAPYLQGGNSDTTIGECAATAAPHLLGTGECAAIRT